ERRRKRPRRINATAFLKMCPYGDMAFEENGLQRVSARFAGQGVFMVSGHPLKPRRYVKIFTYCPDSATNRPD
ncbi:TPA: hypothetical protein ACF9XW_004579, partial [Salmonella enterica subsp. enterica serovar Newport]